MPAYQDFFVTVSGSQGDYTVEARGPGEISVSPLPFTLKEGDELREELDRIREGQAPSRDRMESIGGLLHRALFTGRIGHAFARAHDGLPEGANLRLKLAIRPPELNSLPWELLYDPDRNYFLAARLTCPIVRFIESDTPVGQLSAPSPLRVLYVQAQPGDRTPLDLTASEKALRQALGASAEITVVRAATASALRESLHHPYHILHYDGHAFFDPERGEGYLCLEDQWGETHLVSGEMLAAYLAGTTVRLVVLMACETAMDSSQKRFSGIAHHLMRSSSLPAAAAMQFDIEDRAAIAFTRGFYGALADDYPVDAATVEGRKAILETRGGDPFATSAWATPVLFMRSTDGDILGGQYIETLLRHIPRDRARPSQLDRNLNRFRQNLDCLREWKDLHDHLDDILTAFAPFSALVERADRGRRPPELKELQNLWYPVSEKVDTLLNWAGQIRFIGQPYNVHEERQITGEKWAVQLSALRQDLNELLGISPIGVPSDRLATAAYPKTLQRLMFRRLGVGIAWWQRLYESTRALDHIAMQQMHLANKQLRTVASELGQISILIFGAGKDE
jgi:hypothetical protein